MSGQKELLASFSHFVSAGSGSASAWGSILKEEEEESWEEVEGAGEPAVSREPMAPMPPPPLPPH